jgi:hypothetical protein
MIIVDFYRVKNGISPGISMDFTNESLILGEIFGDDHGFLSPQNCCFQWETW